MIPSSWTKRMTPRKTASRSMMPIPWGHTALGFVYLWQKQYDDAIAAFEQAVVLDENFVCGQMMLAGGLSQVGRVEEAVQVGERALSLKALPSDDRCLYGVASAYALAGRLEEAAELSSALVAAVSQFSGVSSPASRYLQPTRTRDRSASRRSGSDAHQSAISH